ncbi:MAG TPA: zinc-binding dehydrogenase [Candidatus Acidoferrales bacterium]|nr:zinc-binding dehydrogenase [Candidatus Acidoferrales bacterium]
MKRKSYRISKVGSLNNLKLVEEEIPRPADNEVCVEVKAIGLNFADVFSILGLYRAAPKRDFIPGLEFSGIVIEKGKDASSVKVGDRIMGSIRFGSYTTHLNIDHRYVLKLPDDWSFEEGASFIVQALTAYYALVPLGNIKENQTVLIHSAAGGVGIYANRIAKKFSAYTIGTIGSPSKIELLKSEGYDGIIVRDRNFKSEIANRLKGRQLDLVLDSIGGKVQKISFDFLATTGRLVAYGLSQFASPGPRPNYFKLAVKFITMPRYQTLTLIESNKSVLGFNLIWLYERYDLWMKLLGELQALNLNRPYVGKVFPFEKLKDAVRTFQAGGTTGKVVVKVG